MNHTAYFSAASWRIYEVWRGKEFISTSTGSSADPWFLPADLLVTKYERLGHYAYHVYVGVAHVFSEELLKISFPSFPFPKFVAFLLKVLLALGFPQLSYISFTNPVLIHHLTASLTLIGDDVLLQRQNWSLPRFLLISSRPREGNASFSLENSKDCERVLCS